MKFYDCRTAPSPQRARILLAEKGLEVETIEVDLGQGEQLEEAFRRINPRCTVPVLELDDGTRLTENAGISTYLEAIAPEPPMLGRSAKEKALVATWNARVETEGFLALADAFRNRTKGMIDRAITGPTNYAQIPELAARGHARGAEFLDVLNDRLGESEYVASDAFSVADISAFVVCQFAKWVKLDATEGRSNTQRWLDLVSRRESFSS
jgi:glutathione S-transferase